MIDTESTPLKELLTIKLLFAHISAQEIKIAEILLSYYAQMCLVWEKKIATQIIRYRNIENHD